jgi:DNA polymerase I-like protein with 3'-5' exonuclease and polymerase domains
MGGGKNLKKFIVADEVVDMLDEQILVNIDIKSAEIRMLLCYANEPSLVDAINKGLDFHCHVSANVWLAKYPQYKSEEEFYKDLVQAHNSEVRTPFQKELSEIRKKTKAIVFGLCYGITRFGLSRDLKCTEDEAQEAIDLFFKRYPGIKKYIDDTINNELSHKKEVQSLTFRKRRFPRYQLNPHRAGRQAINFKVQNISSDIVVRQIGEIHKTIKDRLSGRCVLTVHDSLLVSMAKRRLPELKDYLDEMLIHEVKTKYGWMVLPFEYDFEIGENYGETSKYTIPEIQNTPENVV